MPLIVAVAPCAVRVNPDGNAPVEDQAYGAIPPVTVQLAEYDTPAVVGPVVGAQFRLTGGGFTVLPL